MRKKIGIVLVLSLLATLFSVMALAVDDSQIQLYVTFDNETPSVGDTVNVTVNLGAKEEIALVVIGVTFDRDLVEYIPYTTAQINKGDYRGDASWAFETVVTNQTLAASHGTVNFSFMNAENIDPTEAEGELATFRFKVISEEATLAAFNLVDPQGNLPYPQCAWTDPSDGKQKFLSTEVTIGNLALNGYTAPVDPDMFDLTFYPYGADGSSNVVNVEDGTVYQDFDAFVPERDGFTFVEWVDILGEAIVFPYTVTADASVYGTWQEDVVTPDPIFGNIALQATATSVSEDFTSLRLLIGIDSLDYLSAGFKLSGSGETVSLTTRSVYESFGGLDASAFGGNYIVVVEIHNIPKLAFDSQISVEAFVEGFDGTFEYAAAQDFTVADVILS